MSGTINNLDFNNIPIKWNKVDDIISSCKRIVLTTHENPDGDGLGAEVGMYYHLKDEGKDIKIINSPSIIYDPRDSRYYYPEISQNFSLDTIYRSFIVFCRNKKRARN